MSSRRDDRDSHGKRLHSRPERDPSPKKLKRDGKPARERTYSSNHHVDVDKTDRDQKQRRRLQDALPLEVPPATDTKIPPDTVKKVLDRKVEELSDGIKRSSDPNEVPRSRSYFQHDERGSAGQGGQSNIGRRPSDRGRWSNSKEQSDNRVRDKAHASDLQKKDENVWKHDGFLELETDVPPARKRPAFSEKKAPSEPESAAAANGSEPTGWTNWERSVPGPVRREERGGYHSRRLDRPERPPYERADERNHKRGDSSFQRGEAQRGSYQSRDGFGGRGMRGRDNFHRRYGERSSHLSVGGLQVEKWKHDLFDETNRSPTPKNEEDQIAKVEALLSQ